MLGVPKSRSKHTFKRSSHLSTSTSSSIKEDPSSQAITPELIAEVTGAEKPLMTKDYFLRERLNNLINMLEN
jgi:hypothetical protein